jgi:actin-like ATPase involved in cell morphogenesis
LTFHLGIDLGTTYTAAAVARDGRVEAVPLGHRAVSIPSVLYIRDNEFIVGEAAGRRAATEPGRVAREFKRRLGDPTPVLVGGAPLAPELLMARLLRWVVEQVSESEGEPPASITVTHPANWGAYKIDLLRSAVRHVGIDAVDYLPEPVAAATFYASQRPLDPGSVIAVYDLGGGTFDAAVVHRTDRGFEIIGRPEGIDRLGGIDFDHAVFDHVLTSIGESAAHIDTAEAGMVAAVAQLRDECVEAKEALSAESDVDIAVLLPGKQTEVRLTRPELEAMIRPAIAETIVALRRALESAGVEPEQVSAVLLVGGSSRIPLVAQMVTADLGRPVALDARPKDAIALGAALAGWQATAVTPVPPSAPAAPVVTTQPAGEPPPAAQPWPAAPPAPPPPPPAPSAAPPAPGRSRWWPAAAAAAVVLLIAGIFGVSQLLDDGEGTDDDTTTTTVEGGNGEEVTAETLPGSDWGDEAEREFLRTCTTPSEDGPGGTLPETTCQCVYDFLAENQDFEEYNRLEQQIAEELAAGDTSNVLTYNPVLTQGLNDCGAGF